MYFFCFISYWAAIACPWLCTTLILATNVHWTSTHVATNFFVSYLANHFFLLLLNKIGNYYNLWTLIFFPLVMYVFVNWQRCEVKSSPSWLFNSRVFKTFIFDIAIVGGTKTSPRQTIVGCSWTIIINYGNKLIIGQRLGYPISSFTKIWAEWTWLNTLLFPCLVWFTTFVSNIIVCADIIGVNYSILPIVWLWTNCAFQESSHLGSSTTSNNVIGFWPLIWSCFLCSLSCVESIHLSSFNCCLCCQYCCFLFKLTIIIFFTH